MGWKKFFKAIDTTGNFGPVHGSGSQKYANHSAYSNYSNMLPEVYMGHPNRIARYNQYENMDFDSEVNAALDILAEFCTQADTDTNLVFKIFHKDRPTETESKILKQQLETWHTFNEFSSRAFRIFRNTLKYGDQVFVRDPETFKLFWSDMNDVIKVIVNESDGKRPEQYVIKNINPNFESLAATQIPAETLFASNPNNSGGGGGGGYTTPTTGYSSQGRFNHGLNEWTINASNIVHLSLSEGLDNNWPFGNSILELIFKVYKQKELLEDAIIIYRVQRAPERRVFKIDVGEMPSHLAMAFVDRIKNEMYQRRIPTQDGGSNFFDSTYSPIGMNEDFFFPVTASGRGSDVTPLPGGLNLGEIDDLRFFTNKLLRGLRIPSSYLPTGHDDSERAMNDGKVGTALIQEFRFNQYCKRLQALLIKNLDLEFKAFIKWSGVSIDTSKFELKFNEPQNFAHYRQAELDQVKIQTFASLEQYQYFSKRFLMQRYLGLTVDDLTENDTMWREEAAAKDELDNGFNDAPDFRDVGITPGGIDKDLESVTPDNSASGNPGMPGPGMPGGPLGVLAPAGAGTPVGAAPPSTEA